MKKTVQILILILTSFNLFGQRAIYSGTIGEYPVEFVTQFEFPEDFSYYSYTKNKELIALKGEAFKIDSLEYKSKMVFYENDKNGKNSATLTFEDFNVKYDILEGIWTDLITKKQLKIELTQNREEPISKNDSTIINNNLTKLEAERDARDRVSRVIDDNNPEFEILVKKILNGDKKIARRYPSVGWSKGDFSWFNGNVYYAPDNEFKIFVFEGGNGFTGPNEYKSFVDLNSGNKATRGDNFIPITSMFKTDANTYVAIENGWDGKNGYYSLERFSIINDSIVKIPFTGEQLKLKDYKDTIFDPETDSDYIGFGNFADFYMLYNIASKKIQFRYPKLKSELFNNDNSDFEKDLAKKIPKELLPFQDDEALLVKGEFDIVNGKIVNYKEWYEKKKKSIIYDEN